MDPINFQVAKVLLEAKADPFAQDGVGMVLSSRDVSWCRTYIQLWGTKYIIQLFVWWCDVCVFVVLVADSSNMPDFNDLKREVWIEKKVPGKNVRKIR